LHLAGQRPEADDRQSDTHLPRVSEDSLPMYGQAPTMFGYADLAGRGHALEGVPFVVIDLETTGLSANEDRIVEIAMARVESGQIVDEWATLIDPGRDPGPTFIHHISADMLNGAPTFRDVVGEILARLDGTVVVAHHAPFEEGFLHAELARLGITTAVIPALCTLRLARSVLASPNYKLSTCCEITGIPIGDAHIALGDVRATAALLPRLLAAAPVLGFPVSTAALPRYRCLAGPRTRVTNLRKGEDGWMRSLLSKLPYSMADHDPVGAQPYLDALAEALADGKLSGDETRHLGRLAGRAGMGAEQLRQLHQRFLDGLRDAAMTDGVVTAEEHRQLTTAARLLDLPDYFADVAADEPSSQTDTSARKAGPRVWCSPKVPDEARKRIELAGYQLAANITRSLATVVVAEGDTDHPRVDRARELGLRAVHLSDLENFITSTTDTTGITGTGTAERLRETDTLPAPAAPAGWYADPTGRHVYRYWNSTAWTEHVSPGNGTRFTDPLR
jgi:DNA polymerase III subunit epsilon